MGVLLVPSLLLVCAADDKPVAPKLPLGKETTYVVGPLDKHGYIDYEAALNAELSKGITPEKNANVLLVQALGPTPEGADMPPAYFKWLDIVAPPKEGEYFLDLFKVARDRLRLTQEQMEALYEFQDHARQRPWSAKDCAPLVEWLRVNEKPLALVLEATKRPEYFNPLVSRRDEGESSNLSGALVSTAQRCREIAAALAFRAMLRLGEGKADAAWQDIIACHRLGRLLTRGATLMETLAGIAVCQIASNATLAYLDRADLTAKQVLDRMKDVRTLPPITPTVNSIDLLERMAHLDILQMIRRRGSVKEIRFVFASDYTPTDEDLKALEAVDWTTLMQVVNKWFDRMSGAMRLKDRTAREKEFDAIAKELRATTAESQKPGAFKKLLTEKDAGKRVGKAVADVLVGISVPPSRTAQRSHDLSVQQERNLLVACALAAHRADTGKYPAKLADLTPKYLTGVPDDLFSGGALIYKPAEKGYLLYSVGVNGTDDGGRGQRDDQPGDDLSVRMPLPGLKK